MIFLYGCDTYKRKEKVLSKDEPNDSAYLSFSKSMSESQVRADNFSTLYGFEYNVIKQLSRYSVYDTLLDIYKIKLDKAKYNSYWSKNSIVRSALRTSIMRWDTINTEYRVVEFWHFKTPLDAQILKLISETGSIASIFADSCNELSRIEINDSTLMIIRRSSCKELLRDNIDIGKVLFTVGVKDFLYH